MAENKKNSRAEKAVNNSQKKPDSQSLAAPQRRSRVSTEYDREKIPGNWAVAIVSLLLFVVFLVISIQPEGLIPKVIYRVMLGIVGKVCFYVLIPALFWIFFVHVFLRKSAVTMRSVCTIVFTVCCGCIFHLAVQSDTPSSDVVTEIVRLYQNGVDGIGGGIVCGGLAMLLRWLCGSAISYVFFSLTAVFTLLGAMQITIPSLIRAFINRPRDSEQNEGDDTYIEPAEAMVNRIANKQIENKRKKRERMLIDSQAIDEPGQPKSTQSEANDFEGGSSQSDRKTAVKKIGAPANAAGVMNAIDMDIDSPLVQSGRKPKVLSGTGTVAADMPELEDYSISDMDSADESEKAPIEPITENAVQGKEKRKGLFSHKEPEREAIPEYKTTEAYCFPPIDLLKKPVRNVADGTEEMEENSRRLNETLASFHIDAHIINVTRGPSVTRYEVELDKGVRLNKLTSCSDDIALSLGASGVRIAAVPGKISVVGIEVPNTTVTTVTLREVIDSPEFAKAKSKSSFAVGKDIGGSCIIGNIAKMPHMLIAGTTGSGKSVCMNSIIISLLYKASPEDVKLIMVDPKMVELGIYNGIPHLLIPVVTDPKKAAGSLQWAVREMLDRYQKMSEEGVRDLESYNSIILAEEGGRKLPQVVIIIDELADLMLVAAKDVEDSICRIAQMGRAAGMHLIIATQRPSADVITGLMKANIPSRIAFSVASAMESRIILDTQGAEKLVGKGDMLFAPIGIGKPLRVQGCFVTDSEVEAVAGYVKNHSSADYDQQVIQEIEQKAQQAGKAKGNTDSESAGEESDGDEMLPAAVDVILETGQASVSMLQRRLKLGYARAARIVDEMEEKGIVGPFQGSKPREILITKDEWKSMCSGQ